MDEDKKNNAYAKNNDEEMDEDNRDLLIPSPCPKTIKKIVWDQGRWWPLESKLILPTLKITWVNIAFDQGGGGFLGFGGGGVGRKAAG